MPARGRDARADGHDPRPDAPTIRDEPSDCIVRGFLYGDRGRLRPRYAASAAQYTVRMTRIRSLRHTDGQPLAGATVVVTRPAGTARGMRRRVLALGGRALGLPGLGLRLPEDVDAARAGLRAARAADDWIFTSPAAVRFAFGLLPELRIPRRARVFAVGQGTARALARHRLAAIAPREPQDADGLLALDALAAVRGRSIALVTAPGGRGVIGPQLERRGARLHAVHVYRRTAPRLTRRHFRALDEAASPLFTLVSSGEALARLVAALPDESLARLRRETLVVSSARIRSIARRHGFTTIVLARSALPADLLAASATALARHRL